MSFIDLNCDMGELPEHIADGTQESLLPYLTSVNIACGAHAGNEPMMRATIEQALRHNLAIGAHPGYADRVHFGRIALRLTRRELCDSVFQQVSTFAQVAASCGAQISHVKTHGALYNQAARDPEIAGAIADGVSRWLTDAGFADGSLQGKDVVMVGLAGSLMLDVFRNAGFPVAAEAFADRRYEADGSLRSREFEDSLIIEPAEAAAQAVRIARLGSVVACNGAEIAVHAHTICIHGDTPHAPQIAAAVSSALRAAGITPRPMQANPRL